MKDFNRKNLWFLGLFFAFSLTMNAQMIVSGTVTDADGFTAADVTVSVVGNESITTYSDADGNYSLSIPQSASENGKVGLQFESLDFGTQVQELTYQEGSVAQNVTVTSGIELKEVVAIGYGSIDKNLSTSAVDVVNSDEFNEGYVSNADQLIQGKVAGVTIISDGSPQGGSAIRIRGGSSLSASNNPLIIIDGLPLDDGIGISFLNPNDIESVSVLKDASATSIYGTRGANGVIIYTTKKGGKGKWKANYNAQFSLNTLPYEYNALNADQFTSLVNATDWAAIGLPDPSGNLGVQNIYGDAASGRTNYDTNWIDQVLGSSLSTTHNLSFSGLAFKAIPTRVSGSYTSNPGLLLTSNYQRTTGSVALTPSFFDNTLKVSLNANASHEKEKYADAGQIGNALTFDPTKPVRYEGLSFGNGYFEWTDPSSGNYLNLAPSNPYAALVQRDNIQFKNRVFGNLELDYTLPFFKDIRAVVRGGFDQAVWKGSDITEAGARTGYYNTDSQSFVGSQSNYNGLSENKSLDAYLVYNHDFNGLDTEVTAGYSYQTFFKRSYGTGNVFDPSNPVAATAYDYNNNYTTLGFFGRVDMNYNKKYLLMLNYRYDGTSRFGPDNRWEHFPGVSLGWVISKEDFLSGSSTINNLKLRAGMGKTGNQNLPSYQYIPLYYAGNTQSQYYFGNTAYTALYPAYYNSTLRWETTSDWNVGLDYGLFNNKFSGAIDVYYKKTSDLLANVNIAPGANFANQGYTNQGDFTTKGIEFSIDYKAIQTSDMGLEFAYNIGYNEREITDLGNGGKVAVDGIGGLIDQYITYHEVGFAPNSFSVYKQVYDTNGNPIEGAFVDRNGDNIINDEDKYYYKDPRPKFTMGFRTDFNYKNFTFAMNWRASLGNYVYNNVKANNNFLSNIPSNSNFITNVSSDYTDMNFIQKDVKILQSDYFIEDGSFVKLDNVSLGYNFKDVFGEGTSFNASLSGNNMLIITKSNVEDPEVFSGIYNNLYPRARMYVLGLNFNF